MRLLIVLVPGFGRGVWLAFPDCRAGGPMTSGIAGSDGAGVVLLPCRRGCSCWSSWRGQGARRWWSSRSYRHRAVSIRRVTGGRLAKAWPLVDGLAFYHPARLLPAEQEDSIWAAFRAQLGLWI